MTGRTLFKQLLRTMASGALIGWPLFVNLVMPNKVLGDGEILQLIGLEMALHELGYCFDRMQEVADITWGGSSPTRFYLNSIYYYVSSMFLVDKTKISHKNFPIGGGVVLALHPMGLSNLLIPIQNILDRPFGKVNTFGDIIRKRRNNQLVHGDFSPKQLEELVTDASMRDPIQQQRLASYLWDLFYEILLLDLCVTAILSKLRPDIGAIISRYTALHQ